VDTVIDCVSVDEMRPLPVVVAVTEYVAAEPGVHEQVASPLASVVTALHPVIVVLSAAKATLALAIPEPLLVTVAVSVTVCASVGLAGDQVRAVEVAVSGEALADGVDARSLVTLA